MQKKAYPQIIFQKYLGYPIQINAEMQAIFPSKGPLATPAP
ncbi:hypothetical protein [Sphingobacterium humi]|nr:hypothetical protein [Sphingobacterium humi]